MADVVGEADPRFMHGDSGSTTSIWMSGIDIPVRPALERDIGADVCIVGAGIAGLSTAYHLLERGRGVVVLDDGPLGGGETCRTSAHLSNVLDDRFTRLERLHGALGARLAAESHGEAIDAIERLVTTRRIDCGFERVDGYLFSPPGESPQVLEDELEAARRAGLKAGTLPRVPMTHYDTGPALRFPRQAQFHPLRYLEGLAEAIEEAGGRIFTGAHAVAFHGGRDAHVKTAGGATVAARAVVVATNTPVNDRVTIHTKQAAYRTYMVGLIVPRGSVKRALMWDTADPYHYVRTEARDDASEVLLVGGEDHRTGQSSGGDVRFARLEAWARARFPFAQETVFRWSGQVMEPVDGLAFIGRNPGDDDNVYVATGDSGHGLTHGTIAGLLISDLITGRRNPWADLYDPSRKSVRAVPEYARENVRSQVGYGGWVTGGEVDSIDEIPPGHGAIVRRGLAKLAIYRDDSGRIFERSAVCPHLGCIVGWNKTERTWDCPCHGSRFAPDGHVVNGPAMTGLHEE